MSVDWFLLCVVILPLVLGLVEWLCTEPRFDEVVKDIPESIFRRFSSSGSVLVKDDDVGD